MADGPAGGAVLVARAMQESGVWARPPRYVKLWVYLLMRARWDKKPHTIGGVRVEYGQVLKSYRKISEENRWHENQREREWSTSQVKRMLDWFEAEGMIATLGTDLGTLITITQFEKYQDFATYAGGDLGTDLGTPAEHLRNNRKQEETRETTPSNKRARRSPEQPLPDDWQPTEAHAEKAERLNLDLGREAEKFRHHATANDRRQRDWSAAFHSWLLKADEFRNGKGKGKHGADQGDTPQTYDYDDAPEFEGFKR